MNLLVQCPSRRGDHVGRLAAGGGGGGVDFKVGDTLAASLRGHVAGDRHHLRRALRARRELRPTESPMSVREPTEASVGQTIHGVTMHNVGTTCSDIASFDIPEHNL